MDNQENTQSTSSVEEMTQDTDVVSGNNTNTKPQVKESKVKTIIPFLILGLVAVLLGVAMVYAYNLANDNGADKAETQVNTNTQNTPVDEEPVVEENLNQEEDMVDSTLEEIDSTISDLDEETTFNDMDTAEFGF